MTRMVRPQLGISVSFFRDSLRKDSAAPVIVGRGMIAYTGYTRKITLSKRHRSCDVLFTFERIEAAFMNTEISQIRIMERSVSRVEQDSTTNVDRKKASVGSAKIDRYINWLNSAITAAENYHQRKETMAWSATVAYATAVLVVSEYAAASILDKSILITSLFCFLLLGVTHAAGIFVGMQFGCRYGAADRLYALRRLRTKLSLLTSDDQLIEDDLSLPADPEQKGNQLTDLPCWPKCVHDDVTRWKKEREEQRKGQRSDYAEIPRRLMIAFFKEGGFWNAYRLRGWTTYRRKSEMASYIVLWIATIAAIAMVGMPWLKSGIDTLSAVLW